MTADRSYQRPELHRGVGKFGFFSLAFGAMIGVGWVTAMGSWLSQAGPGGAIIAFLLGGLLMLLIGLCYAEVTSALPLSGGEVAYAYKAFGTGKSFLVGWYLVFGYLSVSAFEAVSVSKVLGYLIPSVNQWPLYEVNGTTVYLTQILLSAFFVGLITYINYVGVKSSARFQVLLTILFVALIVILVIVGFAKGTVDNLRPVFSDQTGSISFGMAMVFVTVPFWFVGFDTIPQAAEEAESHISYRTIGLLILVSIIAAIVFYALLILSTAMVAPWPRIINEPLPTGAAYEIALGEKWLVNTVMIAALIGLLTSWNGFFLAGSRVLFAMGRGRIIAPFLGLSHTRFKTPYQAVLFSGVITFIASLMGGGAMLSFVNVGSFCIVIAFLGVSFSFVQLRKDFPGLARPYRAPGGAAMGYAAMVGSIFVLVVMAYPESPAALAWPLEWMILAVFTLMGAIFWRLSARSRDATSSSERDYLILERFV